MSTGLCRRNALFMAMFIAGVSAAHAQNYPARLTRIVAPEAGGGGDLVVRLIAQDLSASMGQQVIVDNRDAI